MYGRWVAGGHAPRVVGEAGDIRPWLVGILTRDVLCPGDTAHWLPSPLPEWSTATSLGKRISSQQRIDKFSN